MQQPNILIVVIDSMKVDHVSCYGYRRPTTPHIDQLAAEGCQFVNAISAAPFSPASYASLLTNLYPHEHGVNGDSVRIWPDGPRRLPEVLRSRGYFTFGISNNDFISTRCHSTRGFDEFADVFEERAWARVYRKLLRRLRDATGREWRRLMPNIVRCSLKGDTRASERLACEWIQRSKQPFFGLIVLMDAHVPYDLRRRAFVSDRQAAARFSRRHNEGMVWVKCMARGEPLPPEDMRTAIELYDSAIAYADASVGRICAMLRETGRLDDTIVVVAADHGEAFGIEGVYGHGFSLHRDLTHVPLVVRCPRYWPAGTRSPALVQLHDLHDLCTSVAHDGAPRPHQYPCCLTQAADPRWKGREFAASEFSVQTRTLELMGRLDRRFEPEPYAHDMWAIRTAEYKYVEREGLDARVYDLASDPAEVHPVPAAGHPAAGRLQACLARHRKTALEPVAAVEPEGGVDERVMERLRDLGYVE